MKTLVLNGITERILQLYPVKPRGRIELIGEVAIYLQMNMVTSEINVFLHGYGLNFEVEDAVGSKKVYVRNILSNVNDDTKLIEIASDLGLYTDDYKVVATTKIHHIDNEYISSQITKCREKIQTGDYDGAITNSKSLVESICMYILDNQKVDYKKHDTLIT